MLNTVHIYFYFQVSLIKSWHMGVSMTPSPTFKDQSWNNFTSINHLKHNNQPFRTQSRPFQTQQAKFCLLILHSEYLNVLQMTVLKPWEHVSCWRCHFQHFIWPSWEAKSRGFWKLWRKVEKHGWNCTPTGHKVGLHPVHEMLRVEGQFCMP